MNIKKNCLSALSVLFKCRGVTLRDYFAANALRELINKHPSWDNKSVADDSYKIADAMIEARGNHESS